jgi:hypothetical protein
VYTGPPITLTVARIFCAEGSAWAHEKSNTECRCGEQQRSILAFSRKKEPSDDDRQESEDNEIIPFERISNYCCATWIGLGVDIRAPMT